jgi:hypothetical protein
VLTIIESASSVWMVTTIDDELRIYARAEAGEWGELSLGEDSEQVDPEKSFMLEELYARESGQEEEDEEGELEGEEEAEEGEPEGEEEELDEEEAEPDEDEPELAEDEGSEGSEDEEPEEEEKPRRRRAAAAKSGRTTARRK